MQKTSRAQREVLVLLLFAIRTSILRQQQQRARQLLHLSMATASISLPLQERLRGKCDNVIISQGRWVSTKGVKMIRAIGIDISKGTFRLTPQRQQAR